MIFIVTGCLVFRSKFWTKRINTVALKKQVHEIFYFHNFHRSVWVKWFYTLSRIANFSTGFSLNQAPIQSGSMIIYGSGRNRIRNKTCSIYSILVYTTVDKFFLRNSFETFRHWLSILNGFKIDRKTSRFSQSTM